MVLHNAKRVIVERSQTVDPRGLREIGQGPPLSEETLVFTLPDGKKVRWHADFGRGYEDNLSPLVLDIVDGTPYLVTYPTRCHAYNKWGRPNPPYVYFRYGGRRWRRIGLNAVPPISREANLLIGGYRSWEPQLTAAQRNAEYLSADEIQKLHQQMSPDTLYLRRIMRKPIKGGPVGGCPDYSSPRYMRPIAPHPIDPKS
ncbi:MAG: hypothetical protein P8090_12625 [Gammaproteobacteria bacterium]